MSDSYRVLTVGSDPTVRGVSPPGGPTVETLAGARDALDGEPVDCVVSGNDLDDGDGLELLCELRETGSAVPFVLFADGDERLAADAVSAGVTEYVPECGENPGERLEAALDAALPDTPGALPGTARPAVLDAIAAPVVAADADGTVRYANDALRALFGADKGDIVGAPLAALAAGDLGVDTDAFRAIDASGEAFSAVADLEATAVRNENGVAGTLRPADSGDELDTEAVRQVSDTVTAATDRRKLEADLCTALVDSTPVRSAWLGVPDGEGVSPRVSAGPDDIGLVADASIDPEGSEVRTEAVGCEAVAVVPIERRGTDYGVLVLLADTGTFDDGALHELGERAGRTVHAVACKQGLMAANVVELELGVTRPEHFLHRAAAELDAAFSVEGVVARRDGSYVMDVSVEGATAKAALGAVADTDRIVGARVLTGGEGGALALALADPPELRATLAEHGATLSGLEVTGRDAVAVAQLPNTAGVRAVVDAVRAIGDTTLHAKRSRHRPTGLGGGAMLDSTLTERQRDALRTAYDSGYFDWPRNSTGEQVAAEMDIAPPTLQEHLRTAQSKLLTHFFDSGVEG